MASDVPVLLSHLCGTLSPRPFNCVTYFPGKTANAGIYFRFAFNSSVRKSKCTKVASLTGNVIMPDVD